MNIKFTYDLSDHDIAGNISHLGEKYYYSNMSLYDKDKINKELNETLKNTKCCRDIIISNNVLSLKFNMIQYNLYFFDVKDDYYIIACTYYDSENSEIKLISFLIDGLIDIIDLLKFLILNFYAKDYNYKIGNFLIDNLNILTIQI